MKIINIHSRMYNVFCGLTLFVSVVFGIIYYGFSKNVDKSIEGIAGAVIDKELNLSSGTAQQALDLLLQQTDNK